MNHEGTRGHGEAKRPGRRLARFGTALSTTPTALPLFASRPLPPLAGADTPTTGADRMHLLPFLLAAAGNLLDALALTANGAAPPPDRLLGPGRPVPMGPPVVGREARADGTV